MSSGENGRLHMLISIRTKMCPHKKVLFAMNYWFHYVCEWYFEDKSFFFITWTITGSQMVLIVCCILYPGIFVHGICIWFLYFFVFEVIVTSAHLPEVPCIEVVVACRVDAWNSDSDWTLFLCPEAFHFILDRKKMRGVNMSSFSFSICNAYNAWTML